MSVNLMCLLSIYTNLSAWPTVNCTAGFVPDILQIRTYFVTKYSSVVNVLTICIGKISAYVTYALKQFLQV
jgi:hypothetical protein